MLRLLGDIRKRCHTFQPGADSRNGRAKRLMGQKTLEKEYTNSNSSKYSHRIKIRD